jgi:hypothetical protein
VSSSDRRRGQSNACDRCDEYAHAEDTVAIRAVVVMWGWLTCVGQGEGGTVESVHDQQAGNGHRHQASRGRQIDPTNH